MYLVAQGVSVGLLHIQLAKTTGETTKGATAGNMTPPPGTFPVMVLLIGVGVLLLILILVLLWKGGPALGAAGRGWLDYGAFFIVAIGIGATLIGFLITMLYFYVAFTDPIQILAALTALFGIIGTLVGTYFGVKSSIDAREGTERLARTVSNGVTATITIAPPTATANVSTAHTVTATVTNADGSRAADITVTFTVTSGPDAGTRQENRTDSFGRASFTLTNNGQAGTDTIEASALEAKDTATVTFT